MRMLELLFALPLAACAAPAPVPFPGEGPAEASSPRGVEDDGEAAAPGMAAEPAAETSAGPAAGPAAEPAQAGTRPPPSIVGEVRDGTIWDVAGTPAGPWILSGRNLRRLDPQTGEPAELHPASPFAETLVALEATAAGALVVATVGAVHVFEPDGVERVFRSEDLGTIGDLKLLGDSGRIAVLAGLELVVLAPRGEEDLVLAGRSGETPALVALQRLSLFEQGGSWTAYILGVSTGAKRRGVRVLLTAELGRDGSRPRFRDETFDPTSEFEDSAGSVHAVWVTREGRRRVAYLASGTEGQLARVDVTDPARMRLIDRKVLHEGFDVLNLAPDPERGLLYVASTNFLHVLEVPSGRRLGRTHVGFHDGGERDMGLCVLPDSRRILWTGVRPAVDFALNGIDVTDPKAPRVTGRRWWISSSDGAVAIPEWDSVYLPTWGGIARYDISDPRRPEPRGYHPSGRALTEHIDWIWRDPGSRERAFLVTAGGDGGVLLWPVSREHPDPGPPRRFEFMPPGMEDTLTYQNDAVAYRGGEELYLLSDISDRRERRVALRALQVSTGRWTWAAEKHARLLSNAQAITVAGDLAFVSVLGGFFVVRLDLLPERLEVVGEHVISIGRAHFRASGLVVSEDRRSIFVASDVPGRVVSFSYDPERRRLSEPLQVLELEVGVAGRMRHFERRQRLYAAGRAGRVYELDVSDPRRMRLLSTWQAPGYDGPMQDAHVIERADGPLLLVAKNNEGFALLALDDDAALDGDPALDDPPLDDGEEK